MKRKICTTALILITYAIGLKVTAGEPAEIPTASQTSSPSSVEKAATKIEDSNASAFAQKFLDALSYDRNKQQIGELVAMYADTVDYMDRGRIGRNDVQRHLQQHIQVWTTRQWKVVGPIKTQPLHGGAWEVIFSAKFEGTDWNQHVTTADAQITLTLNLNSEGEIKITAHRQTMKDPSILELNRKE